MSAPSPLLVDAAALALFLICWLGFAPFLRWYSRRRATLGPAMIDHRRAWMDELLGRDMKVADTAIVGHIMSTAGFFASTTVIVIGALLGVLANWSGGLMARPGALLTEMPAGGLELKVIVALVVAVYAFQAFTWAIRQANFAAVMMGAAPPAGMDPQLRERIARAMGNIITGVANSYDNGVRSYYFAFAVVTWMLGAIPFMAASLGVAALLLHRQTRSGTALALQEIASARAAIPQSI